MSTWQAGKKNKEIILALAFNTNTNAQDWDFLEDETKREWLDGAREWYFTSRSTGKMAKVWYTKGRHCDSALMN